jgi:hypothetical protein
VSSSFLGEIMAEEPISPELVRLRVGRLSVSPPILSSTGQWRGMM